jgi:uncharacterized integral membrane protein
MSTETSSPFQERGWQRRDNLLRHKVAREFARWFKSRSVWLHILVGLLIVNLILFFTTTGLGKAATAVPAARESLPRVGPVVLYSLFAGMLVTFGAMIVVWGAGAQRATTLRMRGKLGVHNRTEAAARARALGLLPSH